MPNVPVTWLDEFNVTLTASPQDPDIIQLANGNILVSWSSTDPARPNASGTEDIIGQIFDPMGNAVGGPIRLNQGFFADGENNADLSALPGGGFMMVYQDVETTGTPLRVNVFDANGTALLSNTIESDNATGVPNFRNPHVAVSSSTSSLVVYEQTTGSGTTVVGRIYDPSTGTVGAQSSLIAFSGAVTDPDVAVLSNGNYVITGTDVTGGDARISFRVVSATGANVVSASFITSTSADTFLDNEASVTALAGGGFVISYTDRDSSDTDVAYSVFNAAGTQIGSGLAGTSGGSVTNNNNESVVTALTDGSFIIILDNDEANTMEATHVSAAGAVLGSFTFSGPGTEPSVTDLGDGRFAVTWESTSGGVLMEILDTRDFVNDPAVYTPEPNWQVGTIGNDVFTTESNADIVHGHTGNDVITQNNTSAAPNQYFGDAGDDTLRVNTAVDTDLWDGGAGSSDTIDLSLSSESGLVINLATGTITSGANSEAATNFENVTGSDQDDTIRGNGGSNILIGGAGNDIINGDAGADLMQGGAGNEEYIVDNVGDVVDESVVGSSGIDIIRSAISLSLEDAVHVKGSIENLGLLGALNINATGNSLANVLIGNSGNNVLNGRAGADDMRGLGGNDDYVVDNVGDVVDESKPGSGGIDIIRSAITLSLEDVVHVKGSVENLGLLGTANISATGNALANVLIGNSGNNVLNGRLGADDMRGLGGNDNYVVDNAGDLVDESAVGSGGTDLVRSAVTFSLANVAQTLGAVENLELLGAANINGVGNNLANVITGNSGVNILAGGLGNDTLTGAAGNDNFLFHTALNATTNRDVITDMNQNGNDTIFLENAIFTTLAAGALAAGAFRVGTVALDADDRIIYNSANGQLIYDANGITAGGATLFATLDAGLAITAADFFVV